MIIGHDRWLSIIGEVVIRKEEAMIFGETIMTIINEQMSISKLLYLTELHQIEFYQIDLPFSDDDIPLLGRCDVRCEIEFINRFLLIQGAVS